MTGETQDETAGAVPGDRFQRRRAGIIAAAIPVLNDQGFNGMHLTAVAELIGLRATGVTYYFPRKEELAVACLEAGFAALHGMLDAAEAETDAASRIARLIGLHVARDADVRRGEAAPLASFAAIRALDGPPRARVAEGYKRMFHRVRGLLDAPELARLDAADRTIRAILLLEQLAWSSSWLDGYDLDLFRASPRGCPTWSSTASSAQQTPTLHTPWIRAPARPTCRRRAFSSPPRAR